MSELLAGLVDEIRPDVAHLHHLTNLSTDLVELLASRGVPIVYTLHDYWLLCQRGQLLDLEYRRCPGPSPAGCARCLGLAAHSGASLYTARRALGHVAERLPAALAQPLARLAQRSARGLEHLGHGSGRGAAEIDERLDQVRALTERVSLFLAPSRTLRERFLVFGIPASRIALHPYGHEHGPVSERRAPSPPLRIGFVGSLMVSKAPHLVLEAFAGLPVGAATLRLFGHYSAYHGDDGYRGILDRLLDQPGVSWRGRARSLRGPRRARRARRPRGALDLARERSAHHLRGFPRGRARRLLRSRRHGRDGRGWGLGPALSAR
jgi:glycosyltransferase involved in cell wall biosynthesis